MSDKKTVGEMLTTPIDDLNIEERTRLLVALLDKSPIKSMRLDGPVPGLHT